MRMTVRVAPPAGGRIGSCINGGRFATRSLDSTSHWKRELKRREGVTKKKSGDRNRIQINGT